MVVVVRSKLSKFYRRVPTNLIVEIFSLQRISTVQYICITHILKTFQTNNKFSGIASLSLSLSPNDKQTIEHFLSLGIDDYLLAPKA